MTVANGAGDFQEAVDEVRERLHIMESILERIEVEGISLKSLLLSISLAGHAQSLNGAAERLRLVIGVLCAGKKG